MRKNHYVLTYLTFSTNATVNGRVAQFYNSTQSFQTLHVLSSNDLRLQMYCICNLRYNHIKAGIHSS